MIKQRKLFIKANVISEENNTYVLTELGEMLVHKYFILLKSIIILPMILSILNEES